MLRSYSYLLWNLHEQYVCKLSVDCEWDWTDRSSLVTERDLSLKASISSTFPPLIYHWKNEIADTSCGNDNLEAGCGDWPFGRSSESSVFSSTSKGARWGWFTHLTGVLHGWGVSGHYLLADLGKHLGLPSEGLEMNLGICWTVACWTWINAGRWKDNVYSVGDGIICSNWQVEEMIFL